MKLPAFQFYPGDWLKDANLRRCSAAARGVWMDLLCLMFESDDRGRLVTLTTEGSVTRALPWTLQECAEAVAGDPKQNLEIIRELIRKGVAKQDADGALYSKRLIADEKKRFTTRERVNEYRSRNASGNADVTPPVTPVYEDEDEGFKERNSPKNSPSENGDKTLLEVTKLHPDSDHYESAERIPPLLANLLIQRLHEDGDKVRQGTAAFRKVYNEKAENERKFLGSDYLKAQKFFEHRRYLEFDKPPKKPASLDDGELNWCRRCSIDPKGKNPDEVRAQLKVAIPQFKAKFAKENHGVQ